MGSLKHVNQYLPTFMPKNAKLLFISDLNNLKQYLGLKALYSFILLISCFGLVWVYLMFESLVSSPRTLLSLASDFAG